MYVLFEYETWYPFVRKNLKKRRYSLLEAENTLKTTSAECRRRGKPIEIQLLIYDATSEQLEFSDYVTLGSEKETPLNIMSIVVNAFNTVLKGTPADARDAFYLRVQNALETKEQDVLTGPDPTSKRLTRPEPDDIEVVAESVSTSSPVVEQETRGSGTSFEKPRKKKKASKKRVKASSSLSFPKLNVSWRFLSKLIGAIMAAGILFLGATSVISMVTRKAPVPTYSALLKKGDYLLAAKQYPDKRKDLESYLVDRKSDDDVVALQKKYPSNDGAFDAAYIKRRYEKVIEYSQSASMNQVRKSKLAVAYLKTGQLDQAAVLNQELQDKDLTGLIALAYVRTSKFTEAEELNKQLKSETISQAITVGRKYRAAIDKYTKDAHDSKLSAEERKTAEASVKTFTHQLETLGE